MSATSDPTPALSATFDPVLHADVPVRYAATVMLLRERADDAPGEGGIEVFMMRRTLKAAFAAGVYVYPGGAVDEDDRHGDVESQCVGRTDAEASEILALESGGLAFWVAAIRECFEEAGVLLAVDERGDVIRFDDPALADRFRVHRHAVHSGTRRLLDICVEESMRLATGDIHYVSHWITPVGEPRRFDTRFFVARAPKAQEPLHDDGETIASLWMTPAEGLRRVGTGELQMFPPTQSNLRYLAQFATVDEALADAATIRNPPAILPRLVTAEGQVRIVMPGEPGYEADGVRFPGAATNGPAGGEPSRVAPPGTT